MLLEIVAQVVPSMPHLDLGSTSTAVSVLPLWAVEHERESCDTLMC